MIDVARETDVNRLQQINALLQFENDRLHKRLQQLEVKDTEQYELELASLKEQIDRYQRKIFGRSSERRNCSSDDDAKDDGTDKDKDNETKSADKPRRKGHGPSTQPNLPIVEVTHELEGCDRNCPECGLEMDEMVGQSETSEEIDVVERSFRILSHVRKKYRCRCGNHIETALGPPRLIVGGRYSIEFAAMVASDKYLNHLPLARQERAMQREGLNVTRQALWDQISALASHLEPTYEAIGRDVLSRPVIGADETKWPLLAKGGTKKWWAWAFTCPEAVYYLIARQRSADVAEQVLGDYHGTVVCDGYGVYPATVNRLAKDRAGPATIRLANCWSHVRRKFIEAERAHPVAGEVIELIGKLFKVEREAAESGNVIEARRRLRKSRSEKLVKEIEQWMLCQRTLPRGGLNKAIMYADRLSKGLKVFLDDPAVPIHNNASEREMRGLALGRVNHYGSRSQRGTEVAAQMYTLFETAKLAGVEPVAYVRMAAERAILVPGTVTLPRDLLVDAELLRRAS